MYEYYYKWILLSFRKKKKMNVISFCCKIESNMRKKIAFIYSWMSQNLKLHQSHAYQKNS